MSSASKNLIVFGGFSRGSKYSANEGIITLLNSLKFNFIDITYPPQNIQQSVYKNHRKIDTIVRIIKAIKNQLLCALMLLRAPSQSLVFVGYPCYFDVLLIRHINFLKKNTLVINSFLGLYDTCVHDRAIFKPGSIKAWLIRKIEKIALSSAALVVIDTSLQAQLLASEYKLPLEKFLALPVGIDETLWKEQQNINTRKAFEVLVWLTFIPLHGIDVIANAADIIYKKNRDIKFTIIGDGQTAHELQALIEQHDIQNITWIRELLPIDKIYNLASQAHCILGIFGSTAKAKRVIPYKLHQALAIGRPVITLDTPAVRQIFTDKLSEKQLIETASPELLANKIVAFSSDPELCLRLSESNRNIFENLLSFNSQVANFRKKLEQLY